MAMFNTAREAVLALEDAQSVDLDQREEGREDEHFLHKPDGQWSPDMINKMGDRLRLTFDKTNPYNDQIMAEMDQSEFMTKVNPASANSTPEIAEIYDGMIRNMEYMSNARHIYSYAARDALETGVSGWRLVRDYVDDDAFDTDILIRPIYSFIDHAYFDTGAKDQTRKDSDWGILTTAMLRDRYKKEFKKGSGQSLGCDRLQQIYWQKAEYIFVGEVYYKEKQKQTLIKMNDGSVYIDDDKFRSVQDELEKDGIVIVDTKERERVKIYHRKFDGGDWLSDVKETIWEYLPIIPVYMNFKISEDKTIFRSAHNRLKDIQRAINYTGSRDVEEGALSPRRKIVMSPEQQAGHEEELRVMNVDASPVLTHNHVDGHTDPYILDGTIPNVGLLTTNQKLKDDFNEVSGFFDANNANNPLNQSGVAIGKQIAKGNNTAYKYYVAMQIAIQHSNLVALKAMPIEYGEKRLIRTVKPNGEQDFVTVHDVVFDEQTQKVVELNDLRQGVYEVATEIGPAFQNQQQETVDNLVSIAGIDQTIIAANKDILLGNINAPGMDQAAKRARRELVMSGQIPSDDLTEDEKKMLQEQQAQGQQPTAQEQAMTALAEAETQKAAADTARVLGKIQDDIAKNEIASQKNLIEMAKVNAKIDESQQKLGLQLQNQLIEMQLKQEQILETMANTLKITKEAMGVDTVVGESNANAYKNQADNLEEETAKQGPRPDRG